MMFRSTTTLVLLIGLMSNAFSLQVIETVFDVTDIVTDCGSQGTTLQRVTLTNCNQNEVDRCHVSLGSKIFAQIAMKANTSTLDTLFCDMVIHKEGGGDLAIGCPQSTNACFNLNSNYKKCPLVNGDVFVYELELQTDQTMGVMKGDAQLMFKTVFESPNYYACLKIPFALQQ